MKIQTGKGDISLVSLLAIWAISLTVNLPGLALTPLLGDLDRIFPGTSELEIQLLTVVPNLVIIPFILLSGKLAQAGQKVRVVVLALVIYLGGAVMYLFAESMAELIAIGVLLGVGCGLLIPLAAGLLANAFTGRYRLQQLGIKSGIANLSLVVATLAVGRLTGDNWHLPFLVYLIAVIPLALSPFLGRIKVLSHSIDKSSQSTIKPTVTDISTGKKVVNGIVVSRLAGVMFFYLIICLAAVTVVYYLPFLMTNYGIDPSSQGVITALFFLAIFIPGLILTKIVRLLGRSTTIVALSLIAVGILLLAVAADPYTLGLAAFITGMGYGIAQPLIYDKTIETVIIDNQATLALSFVLAVNYLAVTIAPFVVDAMAAILKISDTNHFAFYFNAAVTLLYTLVGIVMIRSFTFRVDDQYIK